jgi:hypothetical protein
MRCLYNNSWRQAGYQVIANITRANEEKQRVKKLLDGVKETAVLARDSAAYYKRVVKQPDSLHEIVSLTSLDGMLSAGEDNSKMLFFTKKLKIIYKRSELSGEQSSEIYLATPRAIRIESNGSYFSPKELVTSLHWGEYEKLANLLPFDYLP